MNLAHVIVEDENARPVSPAPWKGHGKGKGTMKRIGFIAVVGVLSVLSEHCPADTTTPPTSQPSKAETFLLVKVQGTIGEDFTAAKMKAALAEARTAKVAAIVLSMDTPGGSVTEAEAIVNLIIENKDLRFIALVNKALSAGAAITLACKDIYVMETATIGAAISYIPDERGRPIYLPSDVAEKMQSAWRAVCRKAADHGGHSSLLAEGMVDRDFAITMRTVNGKVLLERGGKGELVKASGRILTLTAKEAVACGLAKAVVSDAKGLGAQLGMPNWKQVGSADSAEEDDRPILQLPELNVLFYKYVAVPPKATEAAEKAHYEQIKKELIGRNVKLYGLLGNVSQSKKGLVVFVKYIVDKVIYATYSDGVKTDVTWTVETINISMMSEDSRWISAKTDSRVVVEGRILDINIAGEKRQATWYEGPHNTERQTPPVTILNVSIAMVESKPQEVLTQPKPAREPKSAASAPADPEADARKQLNLAENYLRVGLTSKALDILRSVIKDFPNTAAAKEALEQVKELEVEAKKAGKGS